MIEKIALGTVQFGLNYGINNASGQVSPIQIHKILSLCKSHGINTLDTAHAYGNSEQELGKNKLEYFHLISKLPPCNKADVANIFEESLKKLHLKKMYAYMLHNFSIYQADPSIWKALTALKAKGKVKKIGLSLYSPEELEILLHDGIDLDIVQVPYNLFDRRFKNYFSLLKSKNIEIHTRSSFLQGLFFKPLDNLPPHFEQIKPKLRSLANFKKKHQLSISDICLNFVMSHQDIDKVVIGVDSPEQLLNNIAAIKKAPPNIDWRQLDELEEHDIAIINPSLWKI